MITQFFLLKKENEKENIKTHKLTSFGINTYGAI